MSIIEQLRPAFFKGIPFLVNAETKSGGKKTVTHEYVGSNKRFTEELGLLPPFFTLEAIIHGDESISHRFLLEDAFDEPGLGLLVHPIYGDVQVKSTTYSVSSNQTKIGEFRFSVNFETSEAVVTLDIIPPTISTVSDNAEAARTALDDGLEDTLAGSDVDGYTPDVQKKTAEKIIKTTKPTFIEQLAEDATDIYDTVFDFTTKQVAAVRSKVAPFTRFVDNARANMLTIVQQPFEIKKNIKDFYASALDVVNTPSDLADTWERLLDFGFLEIPVEINTIIRQNTENNKSGLNEHTRLTALINLYEASADKDYTTEDEIDTQRKILDDGYRRLMEDFKDDIDTDNVSPLAMDADFKAAMTELRINTGKVLDQKAQNAFKVVTINPGILSMSLTAYKYYGNHDTLDELQELNPNVNWAGFSGNIQAVS